MRRTFLTAEWKKLILANYRVDKEALQPYIPPHTELDYWNGDLYVSLVGFMFLNTRVLGIKIPLHINFPEVNLRFYVRYNQNGNWKRGVVFIKEIVPKPAISFVANSFFNEHYATMPVKNYEVLEKDQLLVGYQWKYKNNWNKLEVSAKPTPQLIVPGSKEEFITQHFWGYSPAGNNKTTEYEVAHPLWESYVISQYSIDCDFAGLYGESFSFLSGVAPDSVMLAEGSGISVFNKRTVYESSQLKTTL